MFLPDLAWALTTEAGRLAGLGRREDALDAAEEAVGIYRELTATQPHLFLPDLAWALTTEARPAGGHGPAGWWRYSLLVGSDAARDAPSERHLARKCANLQRMQLALYRG